MTLNLETWQAFRDDRLDAEGRRRTLRAVLTHPRFAEALATAEEAPAHEAEPEVEPLEAYEAAFDRGLAAVRRSIARQVRDQPSVDEQAAALESALASGEVAAVAATVSTPSVAHRRQLIDHLRRRSTRAGFRQPALAVALARLALALVEEEQPTDADAEAGDEDSWRRTRILAWGQLGNALRVASDLRAADEAMVRAFDLLDTDADPPRLRARLHSWLASLRSDQSRFDEALDACAVALRQARAAQDRGLVGSVLLIQAAQHNYRGTPDEAIGVLRRAEREIDAERHPHLAYAAAQNLASYLNEAGRLDEAWRQLGPAQRLADAIGNPLDQLRLQWLRGRIELARGSIADGVATLDTVRQTFEAEAMAYDAALVALELAAHHAQHNEFEQVKRLAAGLPALFASREVHREAQAALRVLVDAARSETVQQSLIAEVATYLERARDRPDLPFTRT